MTDEEIFELGKTLFNYCRKYNIPTEYIFDILEDQKVTPMIRGKGTEYTAYALLNKILPHKEWSIEKLNLSAQPNNPDEDISITNKRTGRIIKVETKNAVRGSISSGKRAKIIKEPHFKVKCHRSRSNIKLAKESNDRYSVDAFDIILTNTSNALFKGKTVGPDLEIISDKKLINILKEFYNTDTDQGLIEAASMDWRFVLPTTIAINGYVPRTPYVKLLNDENWKPIRDIESALFNIARTSGTYSRR